MSSSKIIESLLADSQFLIAANDHPCVRPAANGQDAVLEMQAPEPTCGTESLQGRVVAVLLRRRAQGRLADLGATTAYNRGSCSAIFSNVPRAQLVAWRADRQGFAHGPALRERGQSVVAAGRQGTRGRAWT